MISETTSTNMTPASSNRVNGYFDLELTINKCKFYPMKPLAVVAGNVVKAPSITTGRSTTTISIDRNIADDKRNTDEKPFNRHSEFEYVQQQLKDGTRCLVYVSESNGQVASLIKRWANECREKKECTNWIDIAEHRATCRIDVDASSTKNSLEKCRSVPGAWILRSSQGITRIHDPPTLRVTVMMDQSKFYPTKLAIIDGVILEVDRDVTSELTSELGKILLENGERCWLHVRSNVVSLLKTLHRDSIAKIENFGNCTASSDRNEKTQSGKISTGWVQLARSIPVVCRVIINNDLLTRKSNMKGALLLECFEIVDVPKDSNLDDVNKSIDSNDTSQSDIPNNFLPPPTRADRKERHRIFAEWLVKTYGADFLSTGSGVLDVAGGNGVLGDELWKFGVKSTLLDPNPRCNIRTANFEVISKPLVGNGSELTETENRDGIKADSTTDASKEEERQRIRRIIQTCSIIVGMHPDEATEAVIDMSLRLGKPFAILPCCVFRNLNEDRQKRRKQKQEENGGMDPSRSYSTFCHYLLIDKAPAGISFKAVNLLFEGRNKVIYMLSFSFQCKEITCN